MWNRTVLGNDGTERLLRGGDGALAGLRGVVARLAAQLGAVAGAWPLEAAQHVRVNGAAGGASVEGLAQNVDEPRR